MQCNMLFKKPVKKEKSERLKNSFKAKFELRPASPTLQKQREEIL